MQSFSQINCMLAVQAVQSLVDMKTKVSQCWSSCFGTGFTPQTANPHTWLHLSLMRTVANT